MGFYLNKVIIFLIMPESNVYLQRKKKQDRFILEAGFSLWTFFCKVPLFRSFLKWIVHFVTGMSELERIVHHSTTESRSVCTLKLVECLMCSKSSELQSVLDKSSDVGISVGKIIEAKK